MEKIVNKIEELETLSRIQKENAIHYFWNMNDDENGHYWQNAYRETLKSIEKLKSEKNVLEKWSL